MKYENVLSYRVQKLELMIKKMQEALVFYADEKNWEDTNEVYTGEGTVHYSNISVDGGEYAQKVLSDLEHMND